MMIALRNWMKNIFPKDLSIQVSKLMEQYPEKIIA